MKVTFPYLWKDDQSYPLVDITLLANDKFLSLKALVDSGASYSVFRPEIARYLGITIEQGKPIYLEGIGGRILGYLHTVLIQVAKKKFRCKIIFSNELRVSFNLIGRDDFFGRFLITFNEKRLETIFEY